MVSPTAASTSGQRRAARRRAALAEGGGGEEEVEGAAVVGQRPAGGLDVAVAEERDEAHGGRQACGAVGSSSVSARARRRAGSARATAS